MRTFLFMVLVMGVQILSSNFFSAIGKPIKGALLSLTRQVFLLVPLVLLLPLKFGIDGIMYAGAGGGLHSLCDLCDSHQHRDAENPPAGSGEIKKTEWDFPLHFLV